MPHVRRAQMRHHRAIPKAHHGMNDRLRVDDHLDLCRLNAEKLTRFNNFQGFIEHRSAVDGNPRTHRPVRMRQSLGDRGIGQPLQRPIAQCATAGGQDDAFHRAHILAHQGLKDRGVFGIHRQHRGL
ncbi:MAG: hypothetical protein ACD_54C00113G0001, partial [uncultured bacterium]